MADAKHKDQAPYGQLAEEHEAEMAPVEERGIAAEHAGSWFKRQRLQTTILINLANIMERADEQILPAVYIWVGKSFAASPRQLGYLTLSRALVQALASPVGGLLGHHFNRAYVIAAGCAIWGAMTGLLAAAQTLKQGMLLSAVNGVGLSLVIPTAQSLTADYFEENDRGKAFGVLFLTSAAGGATASLAAAALGGQHILGMEGWRFVFAVVGIISAALGVANWLFGHDPRYAKDGTVLADHKQEVSLRQSLTEIRAIFSIPSFGIIIAQGIAGSIPFQSLYWLTAWYQLLGFDDFTAGLLTALLLFSSALGGLVGGFIGDRVALRFPNHGRICVTQYSVGVGIPIVLMILKGLPQSPTYATAAIHGIFISICGLMVCWAAPALNNPVLSEIVPNSLRTLIFAFDRSFEMALAAMATPVVGLIAEAEGFKGAAAREEAGGDMSKDTAKAHALANALVLCTTVPWTICLIIYSALHFTYPRDKRRHRHDMAALPSGTPGAEGTPRHRERQLLRDGLAPSDAPAD